MSLPSISVKRKIAMLSFIILLVVVGINSYRKISIAAIPRMDMPYVAISTVYPGASPEEIEVDVAKKIEDAVAMVEGLKKQTSLCIENVCVNTLEFYSGTDASAKVHEVREKLNGISNKLPAACETSTVQEVKLNAVPIVTCFLTGKQSIDELYDYVSDKIAPRFTTITGVGSVNIHGGNTMELHIELNREKLAAANLTVGEVITRLSSSNIKIPVGQISKEGKEISVAFDAEYKSIEDIKNIDISGVSGKSVYFGDVANIKLEAERMREMSYYNGIPAIQFEIVKKDEANTVEVINAAKKVFKELSEKELPGGMQLHWFFDDKEYVMASVEDSWLSIFAGILLTAILLFLFLHNPRSTFIISITMPITIIISIACLYFVGYTFDMMTLIALGCATGILVTNSIIVVENILNRISNGDEVEEASVKGTEQVLIAVVASAMTNIVVFLPITQMKSLIGLFIKPFALTMVFVTVASLFISFTLTAILSNGLFKKDNTIKNPLLKAFSTTWNYCYDKFDQCCQKSFEIVRKIPVVSSLLIITVCIVLTIIFLPMIHVEFFPKCDQNKLSVVMEFPSDFSIEGTCQATEKIIKRIANHKEVLETGVTVGYANGIPGKVNQGVNIVEIIIKLVDKGERMSMLEFADVLRKELADLKDVVISISAPEVFGQSGSEMTAYISGSDSDELKRQVIKATNILMAKGLVSDIDTTIRKDKPHISFIPDRTILKNMGISEMNMGTMVMGLFNGIKIGSYKQNNRSYDIRLKTDDITSIEEAQNTTVASYKGNALNLDVVANTRSEPVSLTISRNNRQRSEYFYCNSSANASVGDLMSVLQNELVPELPTGYSLNYGTPLDTMEETLLEFTEVFLTAILLLYLLMTSIMESWTKPFLILFTLPLGFIGMIAACVITNNAISMVSLLGGVMMIGIVVNNAILIMDEVTVLTNNGVKKHDAMAQALKTKLRPVIMTSIASVVGMIPMAVGTGIGSEMRVSVGIGVVGGLILSSILTVYFIPALYYSFCKNE